MKEYKPLFHEVTESAIFPYFMADFCQRLSLTKSSCIIFVFSEEIAFYNGNLREKQTIHKTFRKLVSVFILLKHFKWNLILS